MSIVNDCFSHELGGDTLSEYIYANVKKKTKGDYFPSLNSEDLIGGGGDNEQPVETIVARYAEIPPSEETGEPENFIQLYAYFPKGEVLPVDITGKAMFKKITVDGVEVSIDELDEAEGKCYQFGEGEDFTFNSNTFKTHIVEFEAINPNLLGLETSMVESELKVEDFGPVFAGCRNLIDIIIPSTVTNIDANAFIDTELLSINIPSTVTNIGEGAFELNRSQLIYIPGSVKTIGRRAFNGIHLYGCKITLEEGIQEIGEEAFLATDTSEITIPDSVTSVGSSAFQNCSELTTVTLPSTITSIGNDAFSVCSSLSSVTILATTPPTLGDLPFEGNASDRKFYVPAESLDAYKAAEGWSTYASDIYPIE